MLSGRMASETQNSGRFKGWAQWEEHVPLMFWA